MDKYTMTGWIGSREYCKVYKAVHLITGDTVAIKKIQSEDGFLGITSSIIREVSLLQDAKHENVVRLLEVQYAEEHVYLVFEYLDFSLRKFIRQSTSAAASPQVIKHFLLQILRGVAYCHSHRIILRDLKPENLLIDIPNNILKLADFGLSRAVDAPLEIYTNKVGTLHYMAPEMLFGLGKYSAPVDIWAVGCIFGEMVRRQPMFHGFLTGSFNQMHRICSVMGSPNEENWPGVTLLYPPLKIIRQWPSKDLSKEFPGLEPAGVDLLSKLLCLDPSRRITARDALKHAYFRDV